MDIKWTAVGVLLAGLMGGLAHAQQTAQEKIIAANERMAVLRAQQQELDMQAQIAAKVSEIKRIKGRHDDAINVVVKQPDVVVNVVVKLSKTEESAIKALLRTPHHTASSLAATLEVSQRQAQRVIASLKKKVGLKRRGADKNGEWYFEGAAK